MGIQPLSVDVPFPSLAGITPDRRQAEIISPAYAAARGELTAILQYIYHHFYFEKNDMHGFANTYERIFVSEMRHFEILGKALLLLGADPIFVSCPPHKVNFFTTSYVSYSKTPKQMLLDDISAEMNAIQCYKCIIEQLGDAPVGALISRILMDEELHLKTFKEMFSAEAYM